MAPPSLRAKGIFDKRVHPENPCGPDEETHLDFGVPVEKDASNEKQQLHLSDKNEIRRLVQNVEAFTSPLLPLMHTKGLC